ncbi:hypothetical protein ACJX0J_010476 [Zea mays]
MSLLLIDYLTCFHVHLFIWKNNILTINGIDVPMLKIRAHFLNEWFWDTDVVVGSFGLTDYFWNSVFSCGSFGLKDYFWNSVFSCIETEKRFKKINIREFYYFFHFKGKKNKKYYEPQKIQILSKEVIVSLVTGF